MRQRDQKISANDIARLLTQIATLINAGIPILKSFAIVEQSQTNSALRRLIDAIKRDISAGKPLHYCLQQHPRYFDELTIRLIHIGEHTGKLDTLLTTIAQHHENKLALQRRIKQSLFYPCIIMTVAIVITICMFIFIIPRFAALYQDMYQQLPLLTRIIFYLSEQFRHGLWFACLLTISFIALSMRYHPALRLKIHCLQFISRQPYLKAAIHQIYLARFARHLAITHAAGIPLPDALKLCANACSNSEIANAIMLVRAKINAGLQLNRAMQTHACFPPLMTQMIQVGEESGALTHMLTKIGDLFEADIDVMLNRCCQLLEPLIMVVLGVLIGGIVIGMYLPIFQIGHTF